MAGVTAVVGNKTLSIVSTYGKIDANAIFKANYQAIGGETKVKNENSLYKKGTIESNGNRYTIEEWDKETLKITKTNKLPR